jgi:hypothetical protein
MLTPDLPADTYANDLRAIAVARAARDHDQDGAE